MAYHFKAFEKCYLYLVFEFSYISRIYKHKPVNRIFIFSEMIITPIIQHKSTAFLWRPQKFVYILGHLLCTKNVVRKCSLCCLDAVDSK